MRRLLILFAAIAVSAQAYAGGPFEFGVKAGMDYQANDFNTTVSSIKNLDLKSNSGWFAGLVAEIDLGLIAVQPEIIYSHNKFGVDGADGNLKLSKLDLPVLLELDFLKIFSVQAGPTFCLMTDTNGKTGGYDWDLKRPTVGYALGLEARIWKLGVTARYNGAFERSEVFGFATGKNKINTFQLGVGYYF